MLYKKLDCNQKRRNAKQQLQRDNVVTLTPTAPTIKCPFGGVKVSTAPTTSATLCFPATTTSDNSSSSSSNRWVDNHPEQDNNQESRIAGVPLRRGGNVVVRGGPGGGGAVGFRGPRGNNVVVRSTGGGGFHGGGGYSHRGNDVVVRGPRGNFVGVNRVGYGGGVGYGRYGGGIVVAPPPLIRALPPAVVAVRPPVTAFVPPVAASAVVADPLVSGTAVGVIGRGGIGSGVNPLVNPLPGTINTSRGVFLGGAGGDGNGSVSGDTLATAFTITDPCDIKQCFNLLAPSLMLIVTESDLCTGSYVPTCSTVSGSMLTLIFLASGADFQIECTARFEGDFGITQSNALIARSVATFPQLYNKSFLAGGGPGNLYITQTPAPNTTGTVRVSLRIPTAAIIVTSGFDAVFGTNSGFADSNSLCLGVNDNGCTLNNLTYKDLLLKVVEGLLELFRVPRGLWNRQWYNCLEPRSQACLEIVE